MWYMVEGRRVSRVVEKEGQGGCKGEEGGDGMVNSMMWLIASLAMVCYPLNRVPRFGVQMTQKTC